MTRPGSLMALDVERIVTEAWRIVEMELPDQWRIRSLIEMKPGGPWEIVTTNGDRITVAMAPTPGAALSSLVTKP